MASDEAEELVQLIAPLPAVGDTIDPADGPLGFRAFVLHGLDVVTSGSYESISVLGDEIVVVRADGVTETLKDSDRSAHSLLRSMAEPHVSEEIFRAIPE